MMGLSKTIVNLLGGKKAKNNEQEYFDRHDRASHDPASPANSVSGQSVSLINGKSRSSLKSTGPSSSGAYNYIDKEDPPPRPQSGPIPPLNKKDAKKSRNIKDEISISQKLSSSKGGLAERSARFGRGEKLVSPKPQLSDRYKYKKPTKKNSDNLYSNESLEQQLLVRDTGSDDEWERNMYSKSNLQLGTQSARKGPGGGAYDFQKERNISARSNTAMSARSDSAASSATHLTHITSNLPPPSPKLAISLLAENLNISKEKEPQFKFASQGLQGRKRPPPLLNASSDSTTNVASAMTQIQPLHNSEDDDEVEHDLKIERIYSTDAAVQKRNPQAAQKSKFSQTSNLDMSKRKMKNKPKLVLEKAESIESEEYTFAPFDNNDEDPFTIDPDSIRDMNQIAPNLGNPGSARKGALDVFAEDGTFHDGGFILTQGGIIETPNRIKRQNSDGCSLEGIPKSNHEIVTVNSLDDITIVGKLGQGASGVVRLGYHEQSAKNMALKFVNVYDEGKRNQLLKELETLQAYVSRFLVRFYGAFYDGSGGVHIALEYMDAGALSDIIEKSGSIPEEITKIIAGHCLHGLRFLHEYKVLHRDFKTANILISRALNRAKLSDFGLARDLDDGCSKADTFVGTLAYMSPERLHGSPYTYAGDIWGLGVSVVECLLGEYPFEKPQSFFDYIDVTSKTDSLIPKNKFSPQCEDFVALCTNIDPKMRPPADVLLKHDWIASASKDPDVFRKWLDGLSTNKIKNKTSKRL